jgi:hypothetical protein
MASRVELRPISDYEGNRLRKLSSRVRHLAVISSVCAPPGWVG